ncbi:MAG TPA: hypothetical protein VMO88_15225, partial [Acidimicrobiales bacterium]|nr:hypothetical protein [Acidimicrobiales bacterium]
ISWLRSRSVSTFSDSVGSFRHNLTVLEKATPMRVMPANRLRDVPLGPARTPAPLSARRPGSPAGVIRPPATTVALRRRRAQKRRRDVLFALVAGVLGSFALAMIPGLSIMWSVQVLFDLLLAGYVTLLVRQRNLAAERDLKLRFMPSATPPARPRPAYDFSGGYTDLDLRRAVN